MKTAERIPQLDGLRGVAILSVILWHYFYCQLQFPFKSTPAYLQKLFSLTFTGVDLFFVLSGFLIGGILLANRTADNYFQVFYVRRFARILPLYFLLVLVMWTAPIPARLAPMVTGSLPWWSYLTLTQNWQMVRNFGAPWLDVTWSLAIEEQFYLIAPLLIAFASRRVLILICLTGIFVAPVARWYYTDLLAFVGTLARMDALFVGVLLASAIQSARFVLFCKSHRRLLWTALIIFGLGMCWLTVSSYALGVFTHSWFALFYGCALLCVLIDPQSRLASSLSNRSLIQCGTLCYGLYLFHQPVSWLLHLSFTQQSPQIKSVRDLALTLAALAITFILAHLSFRYFERPLIQWSHRFRYK